MGLILLLVLLFLCVCALPMYSFYRPWGGGRNGLLLLALGVLILLLSMSLLSWHYVIPRYYVRPVEVVNPPPVQIIDRRPVTVINPAPNSGEPVRVVPGKPEPPSP
jgi:hypothetical protein